MSQSSSQVSTLRHLGNMLADAGLRCDYRDRGEADGPETLVVFGNVDRPVSLTLASSAHEVMGKADEFGPFDYLQFYVDLDIAVKTRWMDETRTLVLDINNKLPLLGLSMVGRESARVVFRHMMLIEAGRIDVRIVERALELIGFLVSEHLPLLSSIATAEIR